MCHFRCSINWLHTRKGKYLWPWPENWPCLFYYFIVIFEIFRIHLLKIWIVTTIVSYFKIVFQNVLRDWTPKKVHMSTLIIKTHFKGIQGYFLMVKYIKVSVGSFRKVNPLSENTYIIYKICQSLLFVWWFYTQRDVAKPVDQDYMLENWTSTFESFMVDTMIWYNIMILPFQNFGMTQSSVDVCYIHRILPHRLWLVILLIPRRRHGHGR